MWKRFRSSRGRRYSATRVKRRIATIATILVAASIAIATPGVARAANNDEEALALVDGVFSSDFVEGKYADALEKLQLAATVCKDGCSATASSKVYIAIGTVFAAGLAKPDDAKEAFRLALKADPNAQLMKGFDADEVKEAFKEAGGSGGASAAKKPAAGGKKGGIPKKDCSGSGRPPRGWRSGGAYKCYQDALGAEDKREWLECAGFALGSTEVEERSTSRFLAGSCLERGGRWVDAVAQYEKVAQAGTAASRQGSERGDALRAKIPKLVVRPPSKAADLVVRIDGSEVAPSQLGGEIWVDPGEHTVTATGRLGSEDNLEFEQTVIVGEFETGNVEVRLVPKGATITDSTIMKCMTAAKTREDFAKCIGDGPRGSELNYLFGSEVSGYVDDDHVAVVTPGVYATVTQPTDGWSVGGSFLVDVVTAASSDIVATASPRWTETRYVPGANGSMKFGDFTTGVHASASIEPDYLALGAGISASADLVQKTVTPTLSYDFGFDISGRSGTSYSTFARTNPPARYRWQPLARHGQGDRRHHRRNGRARVRRHLQALSLHSPVRSLARRAGARGTPGRRGRRGPQPRARPRAAPHRSATLRARGSYRASLLREHDPGGAASLWRHVGRQGHHHRRHVPGRPLAALAGLAPPARPSADGRQLLAGRLCVDPNADGSPDPGAADRRPRARPAHRGDGRRRRARRARRREALLALAQRRRGLHTVPGHAVHPRAARRVRRPDRGARDRMKGHNAPRALVLATLAITAAASLGFATSGCGNPASDVRIEQLGGENPNVEPGEYHRPGQPCVLCHSEYEGAAPLMSVAGTVFADQITLLPVEGALVVLTDTRGITVSVETNCVGNFFVPAGAWDDKYRDPQFPLSAEIRCPTYDETGQPIVDDAGAAVLRVKSMGSVISRDGSCAGCHTSGPHQLDSPGRIFCNAVGETNPFPPIRGDCPGEVR